MSVRVPRLPLAGTLALLVGAAACTRDVATTAAGVGTTTGPQAPVSVRLASSSSASSDPERQRLHGHPGGRFRRRRRLRRLRRRRRSPLARLVGLDAHPGRGLAGRDRHQARGARGHARQRQHGRFDRGGQRQGPRLERAGVGLGHAADRQRAPGPDPSARLRGDRDPGRDGHVAGGTLPARPPVHREPADLLRFDAGHARRAIPSRGAWATP